MNVSTTQYKHCDLIEVSGKIDHYTAPQLSDTLDALFNARRYNLVLDMENVEYMSSTGIRILAKAQTTCKGNDGDLVLALVPERVYEALDLVALIKYFKMYDNVLDAVGSF